MIREIQEYDDCTSGEKSWTNTERRRGVKDARHTSEGEHKPHSEECRKRTEEAIKYDEIDKARWEKYDTRITRG